MTSRHVRIAVVGDTHDEWDPVKDGRALADIKPDLVLFTGDFGNENVELVRNVGNVGFPKAAILGNHDCWYTALCNPSPGDPVDLQLQSLGECHVGYRRLDFPELKISVVGGRPFSTGGNTFNPSRLLSKRYGISSMRQSARKISELALSAPKDHALVFLGHNGPTGLGSRPNDICGKDWSLTTFADHGDEDLEEALKIVKQRGSHNTPLVVFGHMHKTLAHNRGFRTMLVTGPDKTVYLNAAVVPRVRSMENNSNEHVSVTERNFTVVGMVDGEVEKVAEVWIGLDGEEIVFNREEHVLISSL